MIRISLSSPRELWEVAKRTIPAGERSRVIAQTTEHELQRCRRLESIQQLQALHKRVLKILSP